MNVARVLLIPLAVTIGGPGLAAGPDSPSDGETFRLTVSLGSLHDRFRYRFENPSTFNTTELVPHSFTQTYEGQGSCALARARYVGLGRAWETELALTPEQTMRGDDFDRFLQPDGDLVVLGTTGNVAMRSFRLAQTVDLTSIGGFVVRVGYQHWRDRSERAGFRLIARKCK